MKTTKQLKNRLRNNISKTPDKSDVNNETRIDGHESHGSNNSNDKSNILNLIIPPEEQYQPFSEFGKMWIWKIFLEYVLKHTESRMHEGWMMML